MAGDDATAGGDRPAAVDHGPPRWFRVEVYDGAVVELSRALIGTGCLVLCDETGLRVALPGLDAARAETGIRAFLASWRFGDSAELRTAS